MKKLVKYYVKDELVEKEYMYIPFRFIAAILLAVLEVAAILGIVIALCYYIPYFYLLAWMTEIACVIQVVASDDNPDYKVPWLLLLLVRKRMVVFLHNALLSVLKDIITDNRLCITG